MRGRRGPTFARLSPPPLLLLLLLLLLQSAQAAALATAPAAAMPQRMLASASANASLAPGNATGPAAANASAVHELGAGASGNAFKDGAPRAATATFVPSEGLPSGSITLSQASPDAITTISVSLSGLEAAANQFHVHNSRVAGACSSTGGHFDPMGVKVPTYTTCTGDAAAKAAGCYVGDLSGKFGTLDGASASASFMDSSVSLFGANSILGRSIVIHKFDGSRWACATIASVVTAGGSAATLWRLVGTFVLLIGLGASVHACSWSKNAGRCCRGCAAANRQYGDMKHELAVVFDEKAAFEERARREKLAERAEELHRQAALSATTSDAVLHRHPQDLDTATLTATQLEAYLVDFHEPFRAARLAQVAPPDDVKKAYKKALTRARLLGKPPPPKPAELMREHKRKLPPLLENGGGAAPGSARSAGSSRRGGSKVAPQRIAGGDV